MQRKYPESRSIVLKTTAKQQNTNIRSYVHVEGKGAQRHNSNNNLMPEVLASVLHRSCYCYRHNQTIVVSERVLTPYYGCGNSLLLVPCPICDIISLRIFYWFIENWLPNYVLTKVLLATILDQYLAKSHTNYSQDWMKHYIFSLIS